MEADMDLGQLIVIGLSVVMVAWFFGMSTYNRQREEKIFRWIYRSLKKYGEPSPVEQAGKRARIPGLEVSKAKGPFQRIQVNFRLERRENPPLWLFQHLQGLRDELEIRLRLKSTLKNRINGESPEVLKETFGSNSGAFIVQGVKSDGRELLLRFSIKKIPGKQDEDFFDKLISAFEE
jgi:hypothetical protein